MDVPQVVSALATQRIRCSRLREQTLGDRLRRGRSIAPGPVGRRIAGLRRHTRLASGGSEQPVRAFQPFLPIARTTMASGEQRGNRETKKPKKEKPKVIAAAPMGVGKVAASSVPAKKK
jgi:hypothetical protein